MLFGPIVGIIGLLASILNLGSVERGNRNYNLVGLLHILFSLMWVGGAVGFIVGLIMFLIDCAKHS